MTNLVQGLAGGKATDTIDDVSSCCFSGILPTHPSHTTSLRMLVH